VIDLNIRENHEGYHLLIKCPPPVGYKSLAQEEKAGDAGPPVKAAALTQTQKNALAAKQKNHAMQIAMRPGQQILMNAFMMYMSGSQLNIFSISITSSAVLTPLASLMNLEQTFGHLQKVDLSTAKAVYVLLNLAWLALGLYKMSSMRLLPTTSADWTSKLQWKEMRETTSIPPDAMIV